MDFVGAIEGKFKVGFGGRAVDEDAVTDGKATGLLDGSAALKEGSAGGEHVIYNQRFDAGGNCFVASKGFDPVLGFDIGAGEPQLAGDFEGDDDPAGGRADHELDASVFVVLSKLGAESA